MKIVNVAGLDVSKLLVGEAWKEFKGAYPKEFQDFMAQYLEGEAPLRESTLYS